MASATRSLTEPHVHAHTKYRLFPDEPMFFHAGILTERGAEPSSIDSETDTRALRNHLQLKLRSVHESSADYCPAVFRFRLRRKTIVTNATKPSTVQRTPAV
ncbi:hypothetical protein [Haladaptatus sp. DFWS20]|uniref:hypothetical protein n=1 Tax=Haladaptatus sp. DFWS20 TaxID=3403467 RepID=UPI003EBE1B17